MIQVRDVLQARFGKIDQAVELFKNFPSLPAPYNAAQVHFSVLTDISGEMYTLVNEWVVENLGAWDRVQAEQFGSDEFAAWFKQFQLFVEGGQREYYHVEGDYQDWTHAGAIVVRESYRAHKWQIQQAVSLLQRYGALLVDRGVGQHPRILTDASGQMFQAIIEIETESLAAWEAQRRDLFTQPEFEVWFVQLTNAVEAGAHDFFRVEHTAVS
ncbi:MAG: hypothetical protein LC737_06440 [Chloroflexi bacterium]|nr:hypothetical protein [Chloroflexota bacterium]